MGIGLIAIWLNILLLRDSGAGQQSALLHPPPAHAGPVEPDATAANLPVVFLEKFSTVRYSCVFANLVSSHMTVRESADITYREPHPAEAPLLANTSQQRSREFTTTRYLARRALTDLGWPAAPILKRPAGNPAWPVGVVGSMTHCRRTCAVVIAEATKYHGLGIDAEIAQDLSPALLDLIATPLEQRLIENSKVPFASTVLFSAKESVFKAWYPMTNSWLDFSDAHVHLGTDGAFNVTLLVHGLSPAGTSLTRMRGSWCEYNGVIRTLVAIPVVGTSPQGLVGSPD